MKNLVIDIDKTLTLGDKKDYNLVSPNMQIVNKVIEYKNNGFNIILYTSRTMRTHSNNIGKINAKTLPVIFKWLEKHEIPFDEIYGPEVSRIVINKNFVRHLLKKMKHGCLTHIHLEKWCW